MNIELYINNKLCDLDSSNLSILLKRQLFNPSELNTKDAQKSYSITLPATPRNNEIFRHTNVEEVGDKFRIYDNSRLYVDGVLILDGKFRLSEITRNSYKGNLGVPAVLTVKEVFNDAYMNKIGDWKINDFKGLASVKEFNELEGSPVIFPLVLYGLLPKNANDLGEFTNKEIYDKYVNLSLHDFVPSINCIAMLKKVFANAGYSLGGSALSDERLNNLYMSYKNPNDYEFDWGVSSVHVSGSWSHYDSESKLFEENFERNDEPSRYVCNLLSGSNSKPNVISDAGDNIQTRNNRSIITIPRSGLYKISIDASIEMLSNTIDFPNQEDKVGVRVGDLDDTPNEIQLIRNQSNLKDLDLVNLFYRDNINQSIEDENAIFPQKHRVNFIDPKININFLSGFSFGKRLNDEYVNPLNTDYCNPIAIKGGRSWDYMSEDGITETMYSAVYSPSYKHTDGSPTGAFWVELNNANTETKRTDKNNASGELKQVIWLEKGDQIELLLTKILNTFTIHSGSTTKYIFVKDCEINYSLKIEPFNNYLEWLKINNNGSSNAPMDWNDEGTFVENQIDLIQALPSEVKINDWIDNFCKAFNLKLYATGANSFNLDIKSNEIVKSTSIVLDLDKKANVYNAYNEPISLPQSYNLGFTIDANEEGFYKSIEEFTQDGEPIISTGDDGGGVFYTNSLDTNTIEQKTNFSYCWYKNIYYSIDRTTLKLPVVTDKEIWVNDYDYKEMMEKQYFNLSQRFWYKFGTKEIDLGLERTATIALVSNEFTNGRKQVLNYRNEPNTIMRNYFLLLTGNKHYTIIECYLTPQEYANLNSCLVKFNGDLYNVAEVDGYDPQGKRKARLKLIRKI